MTLRDRFRKIFFYGVSRAFSDAALALRGVVLASLLGPEAFGGWILFRLATNYGGLAGLGVGSGLEFYVARSPETAGQPRGVLFWRSAFGFVLVLFGTIAVVALATSFFIEDGTLALALRWFAGAILAEQLWLIGLTYLRAKGSLREYGVLEATNAALHLAFAAVLTPFWGLAGAFAGFVLATMVALLLLSRSLPRGPSFSRPLLAKMLRVGIPIFASLVLGLTLASADRMIVAAWGRMSLLGLYGFAFSVAGIAGSLAWVIRVVVYPDVYAAVAARGEGPALRAHLEETVLPFAAGLPLLLGLAALPLGPALAMVFPAYEQAIPAARLLLFIGVTAGFERLGAVGVIAARRELLLPVFSAAALALNVTLSLLALGLGLGLQGVAAAVLISHAAFGLAALHLVARLADATRPSLVLARAALPMLWCVLCIVVLGNTRTGMGVAETMGSVALYIAAMVPLLPTGLAAVRKARLSALATVSDSRVVPVTTLVE